MLNAQFIIHNARCRMHNAGCTARRAKRDACYQGDARMHDVLPGIGRGDACVGLIVFLGFLCQQVEVDLCDIVGGDVGVEAPDVLSASGDALFAPFGSGQ